MKYSVVLLFAASVACSTESKPAGPGPRPELKTKMIDRVGRAAVSTALIAVLDDGVPKGMRHDAYNAQELTDWVMNTGEIGKNLAIYDSLDTVCGNQVLAGMSVSAGRYSSLATALADDRLYVNTDSGTCNQYLGVELDATGLFANTDCGGRTLFYDVIDVTYSALAIGGPSGVSDGVDADEDTHSPENFPFIAPP